MPAGSVISPWLAIAITTPVVADEDWTTPVKAAPASRPSAGCSMRRIQSRKGG